MARRLKVRPKGPKPRYNIPEIKRRILTGELYKDIAGDVGCNPSWVSRIGLSIGEKRLKRCRIDIANYEQILVLISSERLNIKNIGIRIGKSEVCAGRDVKILEKRGYVKKLFDGRNRIVVLTDNGKTLIGGVRV